VHVEGAALDLVDLALSGLLGIDRFPTRAELAGASQPVLLPVSLRVPALVADAVRANGQLVLEDAEGVPIASLAVTETWSDPDSADGGVLVAGPLQPLQPLTHGAFRRLRRTPAEVASALGPAGPALVVAATEPLTAAEVARLGGEADGRPVLLLALVGWGRQPYPDAVGLVQALRASAAELPKGSLVVPVPLPRLADPLRDAFLLSALGEAYGTHEVQAVAGSDPAALDDEVHGGTSYAEPVLAVLRAHRPPLDQRGVVLLFTGLSGSGKSTVAKGVEDALLESTTRRATLLDGDVVRRHLSKGLGFSRDDRDTNVRRIGFVAAEVARHGGIAICAPIAPYATTRAAVRAMVESAGGVFVLVHVATPLEVCEARDRKGLYALARAGKIPEFTGVSDPYEEPVDADLRLDTSVQEVGEAVDVVLTELRNRGLVPGARREES